MSLCVPRDITGHVMMISPIRGRTVIDINASVDKTPAIMGDLLAAHDITGCDTVATYHGIGKAVTLKILRSSGFSLSKVGDQLSTRCAWTVNTLCSVLLWSSGIGISDGCSPEDMV